MSDNDGLMLDCISNSSQSGVGMITGPTGSVGVWKVNYQYNRPGAVHLQTTSLSTLTTAGQGIYTCSIPDSNNNHININVGLYPTGFMGELREKRLCVYYYVVRPISNMTDDTVVLTALIMMSLSPKKNRVSLHH